MQQLVFKHPMRPPVRSSFGFSLIEVMVAMSVFAIGLLGIATYSTKVLNDNAKAIELQQASLFADRHIAEVELALKAGKSVQRQGVYGVGGQNGQFPWILRVSELTLADLAPSVSVATVKVKPLRIDLVVGLEQGARQLRLHALVLANAKADLSSDASLDGDL